MCHMMLHMSNKPTMLHVNEGGMCVCHMMSHVSNKPTMLHVNEGGVCVSHDVACEQQTYNATCKRGRCVCVT